MSATSIKGIGSGKSAMRGIDPGMHMCCSLPRGQTYSFRKLTCLTSYRYNKMDEDISLEPANKRVKLDNESVSVINNKDGVRSDQIEHDIHIRERDVGITEYIGHNVSRLSGIIKQRYSDFIVNEISLDGQVVRLTNYDLPPDPNQESKDKLSMLLDPEDLTSIKELSECNDKSRQVDIPVSNSKEVRTQIHMAIRNEYPSLDSTTKTGDREDIKMIRVFLKGHRSSRSNWPRQFGDYVKFVLYKENKETQQIINTIANILKVKPSVFQYGGTKDKRAITTQHLTVYRVTPPRLLGLNGAKLGATLGNFQYSKIPMKLGSITGNHFNIILRNIESTEQEDNNHTLSDTVQVAMETLRDNGFINYFGMQRFGTSTIPTHHVGRALLHSDWQKAIDLVLEPRQGEPIDMTTVRQYYNDTHDVSATINMMPRHKHNSIEMCLLKGLQKFKNSNNLLAAFTQIPRGIRLMYCHGYQSYIWNKMASYRIKTYGLVPILGDLVYKKRNENESDLDDKVDVEVVTEANIDQYTIYDIVLPLPGFSVKYPQNEVGKEYAFALQEDGLTSEKLLHRVRDFSLSGGYRPIVIKPKNVDWELMHYDDVTLPLSQTDLDNLEGKLPPKSIEGGNRAALKLSFSLPSATYATMALRQILRTETSSYFQTKLNPSDENSSEEKPLEESPLEALECEESSGMVLV